MIRRLSVSCKSYAAYNLNMSEHEDKIKALGRRVQKLRRELGFTQEQFASSVGRTPQHLSKLERGDRGPSLDLLFTIASELQIPPSELLKSSDPKDSSSIKQVKRQMVDLLSRCSPKKARLILKVSKQIYSSD